MLEDNKANASSEVEKDLSESAPLNSEWSPCLLGSAHKYDPDSALHANPCLIPKPVDHELGNPRQLESPPPLPPLFQVLFHGAFIAQPPPPMLVDVVEQMLDKRTVNRCKRHLAEYLSFPSYQILTVL